LAISLRRFADILSARFLPPKRHGSRVLAVVRGPVVYLAGGDLADHDSSADYIGRTLFAFRTSGNQINSPS
jgi:hypothetical protein